MCLIAWSYGNSLLLLIKKSQLFTTAEVYKAGNNSLIGEEILPKSFFGNVLHLHLLANSIAKSIAASMLPISMLPVPAKSSAVP